MKKLCLKSAKKLLETCISMENNIKNHSFVRKNETYLFCILLFFVVVQNNYANATSILCPTYWLLYTYALYR